MAKTPEEAKKQNILNLANAIGLEYLNAEDTQPAKAKSSAKGTAKGGGRRNSGRKVAPAGTSDIRGRVPVRSEPEGGGREAA